MKIILISLIFISSLYSQYIVITTSTTDEDVCVPTQNDIQDYGSYYLLSNVPNKGYMIIYKSAISQIIDGYQYNSQTGKCEPISPVSDTSKFMGMSELDFNFAMAIYGVALSSLIGFGLIRSVS